MGRHPIQVRALGFKSGAAMGAVQSGPNGPPTNDYWRSRTKEASWELREKLLNGDTRGVCDVYITGITDARHRYVISIGDARATAVTARLSQRRSRQQRFRGRSRYIDEEERLS